MKMMIIISLVETWGWGTPLIPCGGNKVVKVVVEVEVIEVVRPMGKPVSILRGAILCSDWVN